MERGNTPEEMVLKPVDFHSDIEINLDGTDEKELYDMMVERILENMTAFQIKRVVLGNYIVLSN